MLALYELIKSSHDANAAALAELRGLNATNAAALAEHSRILADTLRTLGSLVTCVEQLEESNISLATRHDADITEVCTQISRNTAANQEQLAHRVIDDPRQIVVRGIPPAVRLEPLPLAAALITALKLEMHVPLVVKRRAWNPPARVQQPLHTPSTTSDAPVPATALRALVFTLASTM